MNKNHSGVKIKITHRQKAILKKLKEILSRDESFILNTATAYFIVYTNDGSIGLPYYPQSITLWSRQVLDELSSRPKECLLISIPSETKDETDCEIYFDQILLGCRYLPDSTTNLSAAYVDLILDSFLSVLGLSSNGDQKDIKLEPRTPSQTIEKE